jgi:hypothetical protein
MRASPLARVPAILAAVGILPLVAIVLKRAVDVPYWDEWEWAELAYAAHRHTLTFTRLWQPHNEHRILVPNLLMLGLDKLGGWSPVREQLLSLALLALTQLGIWVLIRRTVPAAARGACFLAASVLLLGLAQWENLAWGFQMAWFLCDLAVVAVVMWLTRPRASARDVILAALAATVASLSSSQGLLAWPVGLLAIALIPRARLPRALAWCLAGAAVVAFVRSGAPADSAGHLGFRHPAVLAEYVLAYLGSPLALSFGPAASMLAGAVLLAWLGALAVYAACGPLARRVRLAPWLALAAYPILSAVATASARGAFGVAQATASRYTSLSALAWIAALAATCAVVPRSARLPALQGALVVVVLAAAIGLGSVKQSLAANYAWRLHAADLRAARAAIGAGDPAGLARVFPEPALAIEWLAELAQVRDGVFRER